MVVCCSFFNQQIPNLTLFGSILKSVGLNWFVFMPTINFYNNPKLVILGLFLFGFICLMAYQFFKIKNKISSFIEKDKETDTSNKEYHLYFLFFGMSIIVIEIINEIFNTRPKSLLLINLIIGSFILLFYLVTDKISYLRSNVRSIFITLFLIFMTYVGHNIIFLPNDVVPIIAFLISFYFSYTVLKPLKVYWFFVCAVFLFLLSTVIFQFVPAKSAVLLINFCILIFVINQVKHAVLLNKKDNFRFTNEIVHKGNSLIIACNKKGELIFCSESITEILGYLNDEVLGTGFWDLTEDPDFIGDAFYTNYTDDTVYTRKLKCKNGEYRYIQ